MDVMLSDNAKRLICRSGFFLLCIMPTLLCIKSVLFPATSQQWSTYLQQQLGVINRIDKVQPIGPYRTDFHRVVLGGSKFDSTIQCHDVSFQASSEGKTVFIESASGSATAFWNLMSEMAESQTWTADKAAPLHLHFERLALSERPTPDSPICEFLDTRISITNNGSRVSISTTSDQLSHADTQSNNRIIIDHQTGDDTKKWTLQAIGYRMPAWLLQPVAPALNEINGDAEFWGVSAELQVAENGWSGELRGRIYYVDLQESIAGRFGHMLNGRGLINLANVTILNNQITNLDARLHCGEGQIGARLLQCLQQSLGMEMVEPTDSSVQPFRDLFLAIEIRDQDMWLYGTRAAEIQGRVMNDPQGHAMLIANNGSRWSVSALVELFDSPANRFNRNMDMLASHLVLPSTNVDTDLIQRTADQTDGNPDQLPSIDRR